MKKSSKQTLEFGIKKDTEATDKFMMPEIRFDLVGQLIFLKLDCFVRNQSISLVVRIRL